MRRIILTLVAVALGALVLPAAANAWSIHDYRVRDAGPSIVHKLTLCVSVKRGYQHRFYFTAYSEAASGEDAGHVSRNDWFGRGCWRYTIEHDDDLEFEGKYYGRVKVRLARTDWIQFTAWRPFYSQ